MVGVRKDWIDSDNVKTIAVEEGLLKTELVSKDGIINIWSVYNAEKIENFMKVWE